MHHHGGRVVAAAAELGCAVDEVLDLSASLNPFAPDVGAIVQRAARRSVAYPDDTAAVAAMATALGEPVERVVLTNGASEAIAVLAGMHPIGDVAEPEFSQYRRHLSDVRPGAPRWRSNPSAPLGRLASDEDQAFVWDESFHALATGRWSRGESATWRIASLTKTWRCPGVRIGYVIAPTPDDARHFRTRLPEWSVSALACAVVEQLAAESRLTEWAELIASARARLVAELAHRGLAVRDTDANWVLIDDAAWLVEPLYRRRVLVRELTDYGLPGTVRVAVATDDDTDRLLSALDGAVSSCAR
ncbi:MAG: hypothetical protein CL424_09130 [Acidimicrobiaceae bacterium]|nr:hypothetical protein [Acidimicrobiaceae bacterium]